MVAALLALFSCSVRAAPLTEAEALRYGLARQELADLAQARLSEADADILEASTWANPTFEVARDKTGVNTEDSWQISQPIDFSGRRELRTGAAEHRRIAAESENLARSNEQAAEVRRVFFTVLRQQETLHAVQAWATRFDEIGRVVEKLARAGETSGYDRRRLVREQRAAEARLAETRAGLERDRAKLSALLGQVSEDGVTGHLLPDAPPTLESLHKKLAERPDLSALAARVKAANADNAAARRNFPEVTFGIGGKRVDDGITRGAGTLFSVSIPLPVFDRQKAGDRRSVAQAMTASAELGLARQGAEGELTGLHRQLSQLIVAAERYRQNAVAPSVDLVRIAEAAYRAGESTVLELLDAYKGALEAETMAIDLEWKARVARIELDQLTGNDPK
ncbi:MAG: TolC family protein [Gallionellaceae bacterium]|nr:TolC family protein [Gallionellaceae bacterium]